MVIMMMIAVTITLIQFCFVTAVSVRCRLVWRSSCKHSVIDLIFVITPHQMLARVNKIIIIIMTKNDDDDELHLIIFCVVYS